MGWRERDYARFDDDERRLLWGEAEYASALPSQQPRRTGFGLRRGAALAVFVSALLWGLSQLPPLHSALPSLRLPGAPAAAPRQLPLDLGASEVTIGTQLTLQGTIGGHDGEPVSLNGSLNGAPWRLLASTLVGGGRFQLAFRYRAAGLQRLRLDYPGGQQAFGSVTVR